MDYKLKLIYIVLLLFILLVFTGISDAGKTNTRKRKVVEPYPTPKRDHKHSPTRGDHSPRDSDQEIEGAFEWPLSIQLGFQSPDKSITIPVAHAEFAAKVSCDVACTIGINNGNLDANGKWHGRVSIDMAHRKHKETAKNKRSPKKGAARDKESERHWALVDIVLEVYTVGPYIYLTSTDLDVIKPEKGKNYELVEDGEVDTLVKKYTIVLKENKVNRKTSELSIIYTFSGEADVSPIINGLGEEINPDNGYMLAYSVLTKLAMSTINDLGVANIKQILVQLNDKFKAAMDAKEGVMEIGNGYQWIPSVLSHEYGHYVQHIVYENAKKEFLSPTASHGNCDDEPQPLTLAWSEGYASAFGVIMSTLLKFSKPGDADEILWNTGENNGQFNVENYGCHRKELANDEGRIAAMINDLVDEENDSIDSKKVAVEIDNFIKTYSDTKGKEELAKQVDKTWFGTQEQSDYNAGSNRITPTEALVTFLSMESQAPTLAGYINTLLQTLSGTRKERAIEIIKYNYGAVFIP
ncbi:hypothetical protein PPL_06899 [Heterostelium album PN500]|uniref:Metalloprotease n=1 Tax=Heterostelium pallidum (strain ATCC 26659 / Pp 5 / PN500) TaxID=670386 RepID=D3BDU6_HETP5|nr:hypothetical protein PPL_06899 [Heterostelium album PN500]EFA80077.1 hypothetical protein PPL_06899 [Heterostelium album PN500]|eukprot:XP_020432197.1 hypothetical protein PPL_06899 [Heterostelium album PN500]